MIVGWIAAASAGPLEMGMYRQAVGLLSQSLETHDEPYLHARLGSALSRSGRYADALAAFEGGLESPPYESFGRADHALALRVHGRCADAVRVRLASRWVQPDVDAEVRLLVAAADDWAACGQRDQAGGLALEALALDPDHPITLSCLADLARAEGRDVDAAWFLEAALRDPRTALRPFMTLAQAELDAGRPEGALVALDRIEVAAWRDPRTTALRLQAVLALGDASSAERIVDRLPWPDHEDPEILRLRAVVLEGLGRTDEAAEVRRRRVLLMP